MVTTCCFYINKVRTQVIKWSQDMGSCGEINRDDEEKTVQLYRIKIKKILDHFLKSKIFFLKKY